MILDFLEHHRPALERDEVRHNVILANLARLALDHPADLLRWTLGVPGACAVQTPGYPIVLVELTPAQRRALADFSIIPVSSVPTGRGIEFGLTSPAADSRTARQAELSGRAGARTGDRASRRGVVCRLDHRLPARGGPA